GNPTASTINETVPCTYTSPSGNFVWDSTGTYTDTLMNAAGCDSLVIVNLLVFSGDTIAPTTCGPYTSPSGNHVWTSTGTYSDTLTNALGCDSILTINLLVNSAANFDTIAPTTCGPYTSPSGNFTWTTTGMYTDSLVAANGCDSIITVNLTVNQPSSVIMADTACFSYTGPSGQIWSTSGMYMDTIPNSVSCDSFITINLTVLNVDITVSLSGNVITSNAINATYQWLACDNNFGAIPLATNMSYTPGINGNYAVEVTDVFGCVDTSACTFVLAVSTPEPQYGTLATIFPNPHTQNFHLQLKGALEPFRMRILDVTGRLLLQESFVNEQEIVVEIPGPAGFYFVEIEAEGRRQVLKVKKAH
ncbi:MAG: T9SS type A sorting domain-containing protein, partial [Bacteroidota bacterium]